MGGYVSELTTFLRDMKARNAEIERKQFEGRAIWWDHAPAADDAARWAQARVHQPGYVYFPLPKNPAST